MRLHPVFALLVLTAACDPLFSLRLQQPLWPAPTTVCLDSAVRRSPLVTRVVSASERHGVTRYSVALRDSSVPANYMPTLEIARPTPADPAVSTRITYYCALSSRLPPATEKAVARVGAAVLEDLRQACAPTAKPGVTCEYTGFAAHGECRAAHLTIAEADKAPFL